MILNIQDQLDDAYDRGYARGREIGHAEGFAEARAFDDDEAFPIFTDPSITALLAWRDRSTDFWGDDLVSLLMAEFSSDPEISHHNRNEIPPEHKAGWEAFRAHNLSDQYKIVKEFVKRG